MKIVCIKDQQTLDLKIKKKSFFANPIQNRSVTFFNALKKHSLKNHLGLENNIRDYEKKLNKSKNPLSQRYLHLYEYQHKKSYKVTHFSFVDVALLASHYNLKFVFFIVDDQDKSQYHCHLKIITPYTIENFLPAFTYATQLSEVEQFSLLALGPCANTHCFISNELRTKEIFKTLFWPITLKNLENI